MVIVIELDSASLTARALAGADDLPTRATAPIRFFVTSHMPDCISLAPCEKRINNRDFELHIFSYGHSHANSKKYLWQRLNISI